MRARARVARAGGAPQTNWLKGAYSIATEPFGKMCLDAGIPEETLKAISAFLEIPFEPEAVNYSSTSVDGKGLGDPVGVAQHSRPVTASVHKWAPEFAADSSKFDVVAQQIAAVPEADLTTFGYPLESLWTPMKEADPASWVPTQKKMDRFQRQRRILRWLRRDIHNRWHGPLIAKLRKVCDVLLRGH